MERVGTNRDMELFRIDIEGVQAHYIESVGHVRGHYRSAREKGVDSPAAFESLVGFAEAEGIRFAAFIVVLIIGVVGGDKIWVSRIVYIKYCYSIMVIRDVNVIAFYEWIVGNTIEVCIESEKGKVLRLLRRLFFDC